jgi:hypothetical protein
MNWLLRHRDPLPAPRAPRARPITVERPDISDVDAGVGIAPAVFVCTTCGRTDLPEAGDWDPPVCEECDAAINFDALLEDMDREI